MPKPKGRPENVTGEGTAVRIDPDIVSKAKYVASLEGVSLTRFFSDYLRPMVEAKFDEAGKALLEREAGK